MHRRHNVAWFCGQDHVLCFGWPYQDVHHRLQYAADWPVFAQLDDSALYLHGRAGLLCAYIIIHLHLPLHAASRRLQPNRRRQDECSAEMSP